MKNVPKYCTCASGCNQNCELAKALGGALQAAGRDSKSPKQDKQAENKQDSKYQFKDHRIATYLYL